jgi:FdrA protein
MSIKTLIRRSEYHDSVTLMLAARELSQLPGVIDAAVVMGTEANKGLLKNAGLLSAEAAASTANDLVIAVSAPDEVAEHALSEVERVLRRKQTDASAAEYRPKSLRGAVKQAPGVNLAVVSVAGQYAAAEAWEALSAGLHVLLFSDNVSLEDEIALKQYAVEHGLLLMGPGAGTAILNGVALGFANVLPAGPVGIVSAAGTGLQEVSTLLAKQGIGITQGIGTGGRDLKEEVGGLMMLAGLRALQEDPATQLIILISKPPAPRVAQRVLEQVKLSSKPSVVCFLGEKIDQHLHDGIPRLKHAQTLEEAAYFAAKYVTEGQWPAKRRESSRDAPVLASRLQPAQRYLRGLYSGGTLCYESQVIWKSQLPEPVFSNAPLDKAQQLRDSTRSQGHTAVDLGEEEFTVGRPHPMIDNDLRIRRLLQEARDPEAGVVLLDVVLGYGANPNPAAELAPAVIKARKLAQEEGRSLIFVASVTGTEADPQSLSRQVGLLEQAEVVVCPSNAAAARLAGKLVMRIA